MTIKEACEEFLLYLGSVKGMSQNTVTAYKNDLGQLCLMQNIGLERQIETVTTEDLRLCVGNMSLMHRKNTSISRFISSFRSLFAYCWKFGYLKTNPALEIKTVKTSKNLPNFLTGAEVDKICSEPDKNPLLWKSRDKALFEVMYSSGCRLSEVVGLKISDFSYGFSSAVVKGKGNKDRIVYFEKDAQNAIKTYLAERNSRFTDLKIKNPKDFLFVNQNGKPLGRGGVGFILSKYSGAEGTNRHVNPHAFRHTFATALITQGADVRLVQEMLGHSSISTTQRYTHVSTDKMIAMYNKAHPHGGNNQ